MIIDIDLFSNELLDLTEGIDKEIPIFVESNEQYENPLDNYQLNSEETILISQIPTSKEITIAPGEGKKPNSILKGRHCQE